MKNAALLKLSIAIPFYNEGEILNKSLLHLANELSQFDEPIEVFLCHSGSVDSSNSIAQNFINEQSKNNVTWNFIDSKKRLSCGQSSSRVASLFKGQWLLVLPVDCMIDRRHLEALLNLSHTEGWGGFEKIYEPSSFLLKNLEQLLNTIRSRWLHHLVWTNGIFISNSLYKKHPIPTPGFMEDVIWSNRLRRSHYPFHLLRPPITASSRRYQKNGISRTILRNVLIMILFRLKLLSIQRLEKLYRQLN